MPLVLAACVNKKDDSDNKVLENKSDAVQKLEDSTDKTDSLKDKGVFSSIKDAVVRNLTIKCKYKTDEDEFYMYVKGKSAAIEGTNTVGGKTQNLKGVIKDYNYYIWAEGSKEGMVIDLTKVRDDDDIDINGKKVKSFDDVISALEENKQSCGTSTAPSSMFEVPTDVEFVAW